VKETLGKDLTGTLKMMANQGYKLIEMCSPKGYATLGFGSLASMKRLISRVRLMTLAFPAQAVILVLANCLMTWMDVSNGHNRWDLHK
jgi:hypothetical protein